MTLIKQESHLLTCDSCGYEMQIDGKFELPKDWFSVRPQVNWSRHFCPDCFIRDENGKLIIRKKEDKCE
jgi:hypothetical protein